MDPLDPNEEDEERAKPPKPAKVKPPDYAERRNLAKIPTGEWHFDDVVHELRDRRRTRWIKLTLQILAGLTALVVAITALWKSFSAHGTADASKATADVSKLGSDLTEYRLTQEEAARRELAEDLARVERDHFADVEKLREQLERARIRIGVCCPRKGD